MTPEQALMNVAMVCENAKLTRQEHEAIAKSIAVLSDAIKMKDGKDAEPKTDEMRS